MIKNIVVEGADSGAIAAMAQALRGALGWEITPLSFPARAPFGYYVQTYSQSERRIFVGSHIAAQVLQTALTGRPPFSPEELRFLNQLVDTTALVVLTVKASASLPHNQLFIDFIFAHVSPSRVLVSNDQHIPNIVATVPALVAGLRR